MVVTLTIPAGTGSYTQTTDITTTTSVTGFYLFEGLPLGTYTVTVDTSTLPPGVGTAPTYDPQGPSDSQSVVTLTGGNLHDRDQDFSYPIFDLALQKFVTMPLPNPLLSTGKIAFDIVVHNQGAPVEQIDVTDYIDSSLWDVFNVTDNPNGTATNSAVSMAYSRSGGGTYAPVLSLTGAISAGDAITVPVTLTIKTPISGSVTDLENRAEISRFDNDTDPANGDSAQAGTGVQLVDFDSTPDGTDGDTVEDNVTDEDGKNNPGDDEDDHDIALVPIYDLALTKERSAGQGYAADFSTTPPTASFDITVKNQGHHPVTDVIIAEYVPTGMSIHSSSVPTVGVNSFNIGALAPGQSTVLTVALALNDLTLGTYINGAEIAAMNDSAGNPASDIDSLADSNDSNDDINTSTGIDPSGDDDDNSHNDIDYDRDGSNNPLDTTSTDVAADDRDEDDHDQEVIVSGLALGNRVWYDVDNSGTLDPVRRLQVGRLQVV